MEGKLWMMANAASKHLPEHAREEARGFAVEAIVREVRRWQLRPSAGSQSHADQSARWIRAAKREITIEMNAGIRVPQARVAEEAKKQNSMLRQASYEGLLDAGWDSESEESTESTACTGEAGEGVSALIDAVGFDEEDAAILIGHLIEGKTFTELAAELGFSISKTSRKFASAMDEIRAWFAERSMGADEIEDFITAARKSSPVSVPKEASAESAEPQEETMETPAAKPEWLENTEPAYDKTAARAAVPAEHLDQAKLMLGTLYRDEILTKLPATAHVEAVESKKDVRGAMPLQGTGALDRLAAFAQGKAYIGQNPCSQKPEKRGRQDEREGFVALAIDLDCRWGDAGKWAGHIAPAETLPTRAEAGKLVAEGVRRLGGIAPTTVIETGGGLHIWWVLEDVLPRTVLGNRHSHPLAARWKAFWEGLFAETGWGVDAGPLENLAGLLRLPGQIRAKTPSREDMDAARRLGYTTFDPSTFVKTVEMVEWTGQLLPISTLEALPEVAVERAKSKGTGTGAKQGTAPKGVSGYSMTRSERVLSGWAVIPFLDIVLNGSPVGDRHWRHSASSAETSMEQVETDGIVEVIVSSDTLNRELNILPGHASKACLSVPSLIERVILGDRMLALRVWDELATLGEEDGLGEVAGIVDGFWEVGDDLAQWQSENREHARDWLIARAEIREEEAADLLSSIISPEQVQDAPMPSFDELEPMPVIEGEVESVSDEPFSETEPSFGQSENTEVEQQLQGTIDVAGGEYEVVVGGPKHGTYQVKMVWNDEEKVHEKTTKLLTDLVVIRTKKMSIAPLGGGDPVDSFDVVVIGPAYTGHRRRTVRDLSSSESLDVVHLQSIVGFGVAPTSAADRGHCRNVIANTAPRLMQEEHGFSANGWATDPDGTVRYVQSEMSITKDGIDRTVTKDGARIPGGYERLPDAHDFGRAQEMLEEAFEVFPTGKSTVAALMMVAIAAPLRATDGTTIYVAGTTNSGKTRLTHIPMAFTQQPGRVREHVNLIHSTVIGGSTAMTSEHQCSLIVADDLKNSPDITAQEWADRKKKAANIAAAAYSGSERGRATVTGRVADGSGGTHCTAIITSEELVADTSFVNRCIITPVMREGMIDWSKHPVLEPDGTPVTVDTGDGEVPLVMTRIDGWVKRWHGTANALMAGFVQSLAARAQKLGGVEALTKWTDENRAQMMAAVDASRSNSGVSLLMLAWREFKNYLNSNGANISLTVSEELMSLVETTDGLVETRTNEARLLDAIRSALESRSGYLDDGEGGNPHPYLAPQCGWRRLDTLDSRWGSSGTALGSVTNDGKHVRMTLAQARAVTRNVLSREAMVTSLLKVAPPEFREELDRTGGRMSTPTTADGEELWSGQKRGYVIALEDIGIDVPETVSPS